MSLYNEIKDDLEKKYPEIYKKNNNKFENVKKSIFSLNFFKLILFYFVCFIIIFAYSKYLNFNCFQMFNIEFNDNIKLFTSCIITLVSMNLFVTNLLFTHLKEERDEIQYIIDSRVNFKFITYLGFTIILTTLILYFFSPSIDNHNINSNILIYIFLSFLIYIILLVNLYNIVFNFLHKSKRIEIMKHELSLEFTKVFYNHYIRTEFRSRYSEFMENKLGFSKYFPLLHSKNYSYVSNTPTQDLFLYDIDLKELQKKLPPSTEKLYVPLDIDAKFKKGDKFNFLYLDIGKKNNLNSYYSFKSKQRLQHELQYENLSRILKKVENNTLNNNFKALDENLESLDFIYEQYLDLQ